MISGIPVHLRRVRGFFFTLPACFAFAFGGKDGEGNRQCKFCSTNLDFSLILNDKPVYSNMSALSIKKITGREIIDSRGNPTVEVDVLLECGALGRAAPLAEWLLDAGLLAGSGCAHALVMLTQAITLAVAVNSHGNAMLALLKEWVAEFPENASGGSGGENSLSDLAAALGMSDADFSAHQFDKTFGNGQAKARTTHRNGP
jgi:hypothetical protein